MTAPKLALALVATALVLGAVPTAPALAAEPSSCAGGDAALARGELEEAKGQYLDVLASEASASCAVQGLTAVTKSTRAEERLCAEGAELAKAKQAEEARQRYIAALGENSASACASAGLTPPAADEPGESEKDWIERAKENVTAFMTVAGSVLVALLVLGSGVLLAWTMIARRKASLAIEPFTDGAVETKVGGVVAGLVQKRLTELSRRGERPSGYQLDLVVADVELLASNESLETALGGLAEASQFKLAVALFGLIDKKIGTHLVVNGDLAPQGAEGHGLVLALQSPQGLQARGALWKPPPAPPAPPAAAAPDAKDVDPQPYYGLAEPAAAWIQYEAARSIDSAVEAMTASGKSFSLLAEGLAEQRAGNPAGAADRYARALEVDGENVAALVNLSVVVSRYWGHYVWAVVLLLRAAIALESHYEDLE